MQPLRRKAIRRFAAAGVLLLAIVGCETDGETVPVRSAGLPAAASMEAKPVLLAQADAPTPAKIDKPAAAADLSTNAPAAPTTAEATAQALAEVGASSAPAASTGTNSPAITEEIPPARPQNLKINDATEKVLKLAESNLDEKVILTFVQQTPSKFDLDADEIVYLSDVGVPSTVIAAMLKHDGDDPAKAENITAAPNTENLQPAIPANSNAATVIAQTQPPPPIIPGAPQQPVEVTTNYIPNQQVVVQQQPVVVQQPAPVVVEQAAPVVYAQPETVTYFYDSLSPYGSWFYVNDYGWCWQPTVAVVDHGWRPYGPRGHWVWTDAGWYWASDYSWGWAPFHYGRWYMHGGRGWVWVPDHVWGPSWVTWRSSGDYCGWAPLPPHAVFTPGIGFSYYGRGVDISFGFGLGFDAFCFAPVNRFGYRHVYDYCLPRHDVVRVFPHSHIANRWEFREGRREFVNRGMARVETGARPAVVRTMSERDTSRFGSRERVEHTSRETVIYRPPPPPRTTSASPIVASGSRNGSTGSPQRGANATGANWNPRTRSEVTSRPSTASGIANQAPAPQVIDPRRSGRASAEEINRPPVTTRRSPLTGSAPPTQAGQGQIVNPATRAERNVAVPTTPAPAPRDSGIAATTPPPETSRVVRQPQVTTPPTAARDANPVETRRPLADASPVTRTPIPGSPNFNNPPRAVNSAEPAPSRRDWGAHPVAQPSTPAPQVSGRSPTTTITPPISSAPPRSVGSAPQISTPAPRIVAPPPSTPAPTRAAPTYSAPSYTPPMRGNSPAPSYQPPPVSRAPVYQTPVSRAPEPRQAPAPSPVSPERRGRGRD